MMRNVESSNAQDARLERLWDSLNPNGRSSLDLEGLRIGLRRIDHPLKDADHVLGDVMKDVDADGDGRIQYPEFHAFMKRTEKDLWDLFISIDHNSDGKIDKNELRQAAESAGLHLSNTKLDQFFREVDTNSDGVINFQEWRDFLLFLPSDSPNLRSVMSYFSSTVKVNPEGDVQISDWAMHSLGTISAFLKPAFGSLLLLANVGQTHLSRTASAATQPHHFDRLSHEIDSDMAALIEDEVHNLIVDLPPALEHPSTASLKSWLIACVPTPGYFVAGGIAGIVSRTSTAPLDRLKVYLIAKTTVSPTIEAAKSGSLRATLRNAWRPLAEASKELWAAGGIRSLFAGNGINVVKIMPESAIKFGAYEATKRTLARLQGLHDPTQLGSGSQFTAGGIAGMVSQFAIYPLDTLKFRMQCETVAGGLRGNKLIFATAKKMWVQNGFRAFYRGLPMGLGGMFPYAAIDLGTFEYLKRRIIARNARVYKCCRTDKAAQPGPFSTALIGGVSGASGASIVYPLNVLRTRLQSQGTVLHPRTYKGIVDVTRQTIEGEGLRGLYRGLAPNLFKVVPAVSITYVVYEQSKVMLDLD
ncbi:calcium dependent mitochondrial carrier protein-like protein [Eremomyces bilateralis CBS 781.70]|uniref:Mitochondrial thiamine pyrophosphate carrier 1 n=1 Tax=Eremomyces bilateralis CBS 781.70 TaxID=1392243 RepID=A0A6G1G8J6_9PEZI|nr:calcium dependent mitochondrial carrier protein-like protein [Eremomyces bilateralis CBS 781.70]KAF1814312.1 calcium dependent mitochondrial carrier protein-like protein [Eremomyces bilateralis CBS 781.70]